MITLKISSVPSASSPEILGCRDNAVNWTRILREVSIVTILLGSGCANVTPTTMRQRPADMTFVSTKSKDDFVSCVIRKFEDNHAVPIVSLVNGNTSIIAYSGGRYLSSVTDIKSDPDGLHVSHYMFSPKAPFSYFRDRMADVVACG